MLNKRFFGAAGLALLLSFSLFSAPGDGAADYWSVQRVGANGGLSRFRPEWFKAAADAGIEYVRFHPDLLPAEEKDFLIGDADDFQRLNPTDLALLRKVLDEAHKNDLKVVLVMFSLPGCRYKQLNGDQDDYRLWQDEAYQTQALSFWKQLAAALKGHPALAGYNPLNEPHPAKQFGLEEPDREFRRWFEEARGTAGDLNRFNRRMVRAIRESDPDTPIMLDGYFYADPKGFPFLEPVEDDNILYAFHNIAPWQYAVFRANKGRYVYPSAMPSYWNGPGEAWTVDRLGERLGPVREFARRKGIPASRIVASELWCDRRVAGCKEYLADAISLYNREEWHWAFYSFRSDGDWTGLDYELGAKPGMGQAYWEAVESGEDYEALKNRRDNPIWEVIKRELKPRP